jgi:hypothetical protein
LRALFWFFKAGILKQYFFKTNHTMRKLLLAFFAIYSLSAHAQTVADFESLPLPSTDTFYVNYTQPGQDVGFNHAFLHFPCVYDTTWGGTWTTGFAYSNKKDSVTSGFRNEYAAKTLTGFNGSDKYLVYWGGYGTPRGISRQGGGRYIPLSIYMTNGTYAYNSMKYGDALPARKFGGSTGDTADWFKVTVHGYAAGVQKADSVEFYLADYRSPDSTQDYIVKDWRQVNLQRLGMVDSLTFSLSSSDNDPQYGMNTPAYFCLDQLAVNIPINGIGSVPADAVAKVYPNPASSQLFVALKDKTIHTATVYDASGRVVFVQQVTAEKLELNIAALSAGIYFLKLQGDNRMVSVRFTKQ